MKNRLALTLFAAVVLPVAASAQVTLYDRLTQSYDTAFWSWNGGSAAFDTNYGVQAGQRVRAVDGGTEITAVTGRWLTYGVSGGFAGTGLIQVFNLNGNAVGSQVGADVVAAGTETWFHDPMWGLVGREIRFAGLSIDGLVAGNDYLVVAQPDGTDFGWIPAASVGESNTFVRDFSRHGYDGFGYGSNWSPISDFGWSGGDFNMKVEAVPEPATMLALAGALGALAARRRRK